MVDWLWRLCDMAFESGAVPEDWRSAVIGCQASKENGAR